MSAEIARLLREEKKDMPKNKEQAALLALLLANKALSAFEIGVNEEGFVDSEKSLPVIPIVQ